MVLARARGESRDADFVRTEPPQTLCYAGDGEPFAADQVPAAQQSRQFVAVVPLFGVLWQHGGWEMDASGGTSTDTFAQEIRRMDANPSIKTVVIHTHTPGGQAWGTQEAADVVWNARQAGRTRFVTVVNSQMASAGVWIGTAANEVYITPGGEAGSIGVLTMHQDVSGYEEKIGVRTTLVAIPEKKIEGHEFAPLSDEARETLEKGIRSSYNRFLAAVSRNRGVTQVKVEEEFGGGGMLRADEAVPVGLADGIATLHEVVQREVALLNDGSGNGRASRRNRLALAELE